VVLAFRVAIDWGQQLLLPPGGSGNYEALAPWLRIVLPVGIGLLLGLVFDWLPRELREVGVTHVLKRLQAPGKSGCRRPICWSQFVGRRRHRRRPLGRPGGARPCISAPPAPASSANGCI
jgi:H+/Cl- antiporter ClcA